MEKRKLSQAYLTYLGATAAAFFAGIGLIVHGIKKRDKKIVGIGNVLCGAAFLALSVPHAVVAITEGLKLLRG